MGNEGREYIDLFSMALNEKTISKAGFVKLNMNKKDIVIPNNFEPLARSNIHIKYFSNIKELKQLRICKSNGYKDMLIQSNLRVHHG
jgi:hypothetical protein